MISLATTIINEKVRENIKNCLDEGRLANGRFVKEFEDKVTRYVGMKHAISTCNGSMANIVALAALYEKYPTKREVIVPALTFIAHPQAIVINGLKPIFVDIDRNFQIDTELVEEKINEDTLAIMPAHLLGKKCGIDALIELGVGIIEDCCEAFGITPRGDFGTYSFYPSHTISTGEGGMIVTNDDELAELAKQIRNHGRKGNTILDKFHFDIFGFNGKMSNLIAAVGDAVIDEADRVIKKRIENVAKLNAITGNKWEAESPHCYPVMYGSEKERDEKLIELESEGIEARKLFSSLPTQEKVYSHLGYKLGDFPIAEEVGRSGLFVPIHQDLNDKDIRKIGSCLGRL
jgi:dTDP-4-amino-4,6-dideoxygalactose transaminase